MFIYILNLLNDTLKKNKIYTIPAFEAISDTNYILKLGDLKRNFDFNTFGDKVIDIFKVFYKYKLTLTDSLYILNKVILNDNNSWILDNISKEFKDHLNDGLELELNLNLLINNILLKYRIGEEWGKVNFIAL